jgi:hypothetical protein
MKISMGKFPKQGERKINIQIDGFDTWNLDHTMAMILYPALLQLKAAKHGFPSEFATVGGEDWDSQLSFDFYVETQSECFNVGVKRWDEVMDKMIWSFQQLSLDDYSEKYHHGVMDIAWTETDALGMSTMVDNNPNEHWYDVVGHHLHEERIQEGLDLFGKYYRNLWD